jgi:hypothetical protein
MNSVSGNLTALRAKAHAFAHDCSLLPSRVHATIFFASIALTSKAHAAGVSGFFTGWKGAITNLTDLILSVGMLAGIASCFYGLYNMAKKGMNRGEDIEWSKVIWPIAGGALLTTILYVIQAVVEEGGASKSDMGRTR